MKSQAERAEMRQIRQLFAVCIAAQLLAAPAFAERAPKPGSYDPRIRTVIYHSDDVVKIRANYGIALMITFGQGETIETITLGDTAAWQVVPNKAKNVIFIKPVAKNADTNMDVITNKRIYTFDLTSAVGGAKKDAIYKVRFLYPEDEYDAKLFAQAKQNVQNPNLNNLDIANMNTDYAYKGSDGSAPAVVFDDGVKTFFKFNSDAPAIFMVDSKRNETLVNSRREQEFIVVDGVKRQWTLRNGNEVTCVFNLRSGRRSPYPSADGFVAPIKLSGPSSASNANASGATPELN
jgi:type IV secretion system protein VirB9